MKVQYFPSWDMTWHIFWRHWRIMSKVQKRTSKKYEKMKIKDTNIFNTVGVCIWKKTMVKSLIYLLFSYQTGYIMWHSQLSIYIQTIFFLLEAFWLDVTTSKDECTCTRLNSVVSTRKWPFTEEWTFCPDPLTNMATTGNSCFWLADF